MPQTVFLSPPPAIFKSVNSFNLKKLGAYSANPLRLTKKGPLSDVPVYDGEILEDVKQIDTTVYEVEVVDQNGQTFKYDLVVPDELKD